MVTKQVQDLPDWHALIELQNFFQEYTGKKTSTDKQPNNVDGVLNVGDARFAVQLVLRSKGLLALTSKIDYLKELPGVKSGNALPLLLVPYMTEAGKGVCREEGVNWVDLSGNADVRAKSLTIIIEGRPNKFVVEGRPSDIFAPRNSRVVRAFLENRTFEKQSDIVAWAKLNKGNVSRLVQRMVADGVVEKNGNLLRAVNPASLLTAWAAGYEFGKHKVIKGHMPGELSERMARLSIALHDADIDFAYTGLAAGDAYVSHLTSFRLVSLFVAKPVPNEVLKKLLFSAEERGANTWLAVPNDESVFWGKSEFGSTNMVSPIQAYLDLGGQPERAAELRDVLLDYIREDKWN